MAFFSITNKHTSSLQNCSSRQFVSKEPRKSLEMHAKCMACIIEVKHYATAKWQDRRYVSYITLNKIRVAFSLSLSRELSLGLALNTRHTYKTWILGDRYQISREQGILDFLVKSDQYRSYFLIYGDSLTVKHTITNTSMKNRTALVYTNRDSTLDSRRRFRTGISSSCLKILFLDSRKAQNSISGIYSGM